MMTDPIADMLTRIRNATFVHKREVVMPYSKIKMDIAEVLAREGYVEKVERDTGMPATLTVFLKYSDGQPTIQSLQRISTPGHRKYIKSNEIKPVLNGLGLAILSTPRGVLTSRDAKKHKVGGEVLCEVY